MEDEAPGSRVVIVDDSRLHRELARSALEGIARVECCPDAEAALLALEREPAELVVTDLSMPGISGLGLLERLRRSHPGTDFVVLTAHASTDSAIEALRLGAADYLRKPMDERELALVVQRTLDRRRLLQENSRLRDVLAVVEACRSLTPCLEPGEIHPAALDILLRALDRERGFVLFRRGASPTADGFGARGLSDSEAELLREALTQGKRFDVDTARAIEVTVRGPIEVALRAAGLPAEPHLAVPIRGQEREAGVLFVLQGGRPFDPDDLERTRIVAGHAEIALRNAERYNQAKERAFLDDVTELYNARYLLAAIEHEIRRAQRYGNELSVLFIDVDRFKLVNDRHGHLVGSRALRQLAQVLGQCVRQVDTLARYGGDEFTVLLADTDESDGLQVAERIRTTVAQTLFEADAGEPLRLSVSVGLASYPRHGRTWESLLDLADKAMYRAKSKGRNGVCSASELAV
jgi:diguanylate cyclase (GGDEF)-like protein